MKFVEYKNKVWVYEVSQFIVYVGLCLCAAVGFSLLVWLPCVIREKQTFAVCFKTKCSVLRDILNEHHLSQSVPFGVQGTRHSMQTPWWAPMARLWTINVPSTSLLTLKCRRMPKAWYVPSSQTGKLGDGNEWHGLVLFSLHTNSSYSGYCGSY